MKKINLVYDDYYKSVDILLVPDDVADNISDVVREFFYWLGHTSNHPYFVTDDSGRKMLISNSTIFAERLNMMYNKNGDQKSMVIKVGAEYCPEYPTAEF